MLDQITAPGDCASASYQPVSRHRRRPAPDARQQPTFCAPRRALGATPLDRPSCAPRPCDAGRLAPTAKASSSCARPFCRARRRSVTHRGQHAVCQVSRTERPVKQLSCSIGAQSLRCCYLSQHSDLCLVPRFQPVDTATGDQNAAPEHVDQPYEHADQTAKRAEIGGGVCHVLIIAAACAFQDLGQITPKST